MILYYIIYIILYMCGLSSCSPLKLPYLGGYPLILRQTSNLMKYLWHVLFHVDIDI